MLFVHGNAFSTVSKYLASSVTHVSLYHLSSWSWIPKFQFLRFYISLLPVLHFPFLLLLSSVSLQQAELLSKRSTSVLSSDLPAFLSFSFSFFQYFFLKLQILLILLFCTFQLQRPCYHCFFFPCLVSNLLRARIFFHLTCFSYSIASADLLCSASSVALFVCSNFQVSFKLLLLQFHLFSAFHYVNLFSI